MIEVAVTTTVYIAIIRGTRGKRQVTRISMAQTRLSQIGQINDVIGCPCLGLALAALAAPAGAVGRQASPHNRPLPG
jgi:hypothetical protein